MDHLPLVELVTSTVGSPPCEHVTGVRVDHGPVLEVPLDSRIAIECVAGGGPPTVVVELLASRVRCVDRASVVEPPAWARSRQLLLAAARVLQGGRVPDDLQPETDGDRVSALGRLLEEHALAATSVTPSAQDPDVAAQTESGPTLGPASLALTEADARDLGRPLCEECRKGHYALPGGRVSNFPCVTDGCGCWFCGPVVTPAQAATRGEAPLDVPWPPDEPLASQVDRLATFLQDHVPGEPSQNQGAVDTAIRLLRAGVSPQPEITAVCHCGHMAGAHVADGGCEFMIQGSDESWSICGCTRFGPQPEITRQQIARVLDELVAETLRRSDSPSTAWVGPEVDRATDAVWALLADGATPHDESCWLCEGLGGVAVHVKATEQHGKTLLVAHRLHSDSHPVHPCPLADGATPAGPEDLPAPTTTYTTRTGRVLTEADLDALVVEAERGYDVSHLTPPDEPSTEDDTSS